jgi:hypothetical protein
MVRVSCGCFTVVIAYVKEAYLHRLAEQKVEELKKKREEQEAKDAREHQRKREATEKALQGDNRKGKVFLYAVQ